MATATLKLEEKIARDVMTRGVVIAQTDQSSHKSAEMMTEDDLSCIVIVDQSEEAADIITSFDLLKAFSEKTTEAIENTTAEDIMTPFIVEAYPEMNLKEVVNIMVGKNIHRVITLSPVGRKPVGLLSASDIVQEMRNIEF